MNNFETIIKTAFLFLGKSFVLAVVISLAAVVFASIRKQKIVLTIMWLVLLFGVILAIVTIPVLKWGFFWESLAVLVMACAMVWLIFAFPKGEVVEKPKK